MKRFEIITEADARLLDVGRDDAKREIQYEDEEQIGGKNRKDRLRRHRNGPEVCPEQK